MIQRLSSNLMRNLSSKGLFNLFEHYSTKIHHVNLYLLALLFGDYHPLDPSGSSSYPTVAADAVVVGKSRLNFIRRLATGGGS